MGRYVLDVRRSARVGWDRLLQQHSGAMGRLTAYLESTPLTPIPRKTKRLSGFYHGLIQYDVSSGDRVWYWVDGNVVRVEYAGKHPKETE